MRSRVRRTAGGVLAALVLSATLAGCGDSGDLTFWNGGTEAVTVTTDHDTFDLPPNNGSSLLDNGCNKGDVTVTFASGEAFVIAGPVCPENQVVIRDGKVTLEAA
jgi:predicted small lipoprotein YifL